MDISFDKDNNNLEDKVNNYFEDEMFQVNKKKKISNAYTITKDSTGRRYTGIKTKRTKPKENLTYSRENLTENFIIQFNKLDIDEKLTKNKKAKNTNKKEKNNMDIDKE